MATSSSVPQAGEPPVYFPPTARKSPWRWPLRIVGMLFVAAVIAVAAAPTVVSSNPELRDYLVHRFMGKLNGDIVMKEFSIGWTTPLEIAGFEIRPHADSQPVPGTTANLEPLVKIDRIEADRSLWAMLWDRSDVGTILVERPDIFLALGDKPGESNFEKVFRPILERHAKLPKSLSFGVQMQIVDGTVRGISNTTRDPWSVPGINITAGIRAASHSESGKPELFVKPGTLVANAQLNVGICNDVLKYIAPPIAARAKARGTFSVDLNEWRLPWKDFASGELSGKLTMHTVDVGPGPLTESFLNKLLALPFVGDMIRAQNLPDYVSIANNTVVSFELVPGGKIHHDGLEFTLAGWVDVQSHGDVGLDESLDLQTSLGIHPPKSEESRLAILRQLAEQRWPVNIRGKMGAPVIDTSPLNDAWKQWLLRKVPEDLLSGRSSVGNNVIGKLNDIGLLTPDRTDLALRLLQTLAPPATNPAPHQVRKIDPNVAGASGTTTGPTLGAADGNRPLETTAPPARSSTTLTVPPPPTPPTPPPTANSDPAALGPPSTAAMPTPSGTAGGQPQFGVADGVKLGLDVLGAIRAHRQQQQRPQLLPPGIIPPQPPAPAPRDQVDPANTPPGANPPGAAPPTSAFAPPDPAATVPPPRRPLLRQGLRALLEAATQPPPPSPTATGSQPPAAQPPTAQPPKSQPPEPQLPAPAKREP